MILHDVIDELRPDGVYYARPQSWITRFVLHHTASNPDVAPEQIHEWHKAKGWRGIGYHYLVYQDGVMFKVRPLNTVPACVEKGNRKSVCVAFVGDFDTYPLPDPARVAAMELMVNIVRAFARSLPVYPHSAFNPTVCPGRFIRELLVSAQIPPVILSA